MKYDSLRENRQCSKRPSKGAMPPSLVGIAVGGVLLAFNLIVTRFTDYVSNSAGEENIPQVITGLDGCGLQ
ncbi:MAG: hypothetical protein KTR17_00365 [Cellvibrionaceae bacterium]|nr:hypothetical protein [Cellvibrionaceae bacterium]